MKRSTLLTLGAIGVVLVLFYFLTAARATEACTVCMEFRGRTHCATASGPVRDQARDGAQTTACGPLVSGMDETIACHNTPPKTVQCRTR